VGQSGKFWVNVKEQFQARIDPESQTPNPKTQTPNPKSQTPNPKP